MTSSRGAGFSSARRAAAGRFDPLGGAGAPGRSPLAAAGGAAAGGLLTKGEVTPEQAARDMEWRVHALMEESAAASARGEQQLGVCPPAGKLKGSGQGLKGSHATPQRPIALPPRSPCPPAAAAALEKALEARKRERALTKFRDANGVPDYLGAELAFAVEFQARGLGRRCGEVGFNARAGAAAGGRTAARPSSRPARRRGAAITHVRLPPFQVAAMHAANRLWQEALDGYTSLLRGRAAAQAVRCARGRPPPGRSVSVPAAPGLATRCRRCVADSPAPCLAPAATACASPSAASTLSRASWRPPSRRGAWRSTRCRRRRGRSAAGCCGTSGWHLFAWGGTPMQRARTRTRWRRSRSTWWAGRGARAGGRLGLVAAAAFTGGIKRARRQGCGE
jgi:hypothetical protein